MQGLIEKVGLYAVDNKSISADSIEKISHRKEYSGRNNRKTCYNGGIGKIRNRK